MNIFRAIGRFFMWLFGIRPEKVRPIILTPNVELDFDADTDDIIDSVCSVTAYYDRVSNPAQTQAVRFRVLTGPFVFDPGGTETEITTNDIGSASVNGHFTGQGFAVIIAELVDDPQV